MRPLVLLAFLALACAGAAVASPPPGATARCRDGSYSFSRHHSGTCSHHGGVARWLDGSTGAPSGAAPRTAAPALGQTVLLGRRTRTRGCVRGERPDRRCSPGAYSSGLTRSVLCSAGFRTSTVRHVPQSEKYAVEREYGLPARLYGRTLEIDHVVPLELGGSNDIANLFPEPATGVGYHVKDRLENRLHALVCARKLTLAAARRGIAANWEALYARVFDVVPQTG